MPLGTEVGLGPGDIVLDAAEVPQKGHAPIFGLCTPCLKNVPPLACYNFDTHEWILIVFGRNRADKVGNQKTFYYATSNNLCFCTTWQNE